MGGRPIALTVSPVVNDEGQRVGTVAELKDHTIEKLAENEVDTILHAAIRGDFTRRIEIEGKEGFLKQLGEGLNELLASTESGLNDVHRLLDALSNHGLKQAAQLVADASNRADKGCELVSQVVLKMAEINDSSRKSGGIIPVIDDIVLQTKMLAHTAAIEAARVGEQGGGFSAVVVEMRNLAKHAATAAEEIKILIDDSASKTSDGSALVAQAREAMEQIVDSMRKVTVRMSEIIAASKDQTTGMSSHLWKE